MGRHASRRHHQKPHEVSISTHALLIASALHRATMVGLTRGTIHVQRGESGVWVQGLQWGHCRDCSGFAGSSQQTAYAVQSIDANQHITPHISLRAEGHLMHTGCVHTQQDGPSVCGRPNLPPLNLDLGGKLPPAITLVCLQRFFCQLAVEQQLGLAHFAPSSQGCSL